jgi:glutathione synthase
MTKHPKCEEIIVSSRSSGLNSLFFQNCDFQKLYGIKIDNEFKYESAKKDLFEASLEVNPSDFDIIFLRLPRPTSDNFLISIEEYFSSSCIINRPSGIINSSNKAVLLNFQEVCPTLKLCHSIDEILRFSKKHELVLKPLKEYAGKGLLRINKNIINDGVNDYDTQTYLKKIESYIHDEGYLAMKYLKNVDQGDKRLIVVDGEVLASTLRLPAKGSWLCNVAMGGTSVKSEPDERELEIIETINPYLKENGILIYGADTLVNDNGDRILSEINTLSIGGFPQAEHQTGKPIINTTIEKIFKYADVQIGK